MSKYKIIVDKNFVRINECSDEEYANSNIVQLSIDNLNDIINGNDVSMMVEAEELKEGVIFEISDKLIKDIINKLREKYPNLDNEMLTILVEEKITSSLKNIGMVVINKGEDNVFNIRIKQKRNEMVINGDESNNKSSLNTDIITEIDMSKFKPSEVIKTIKKKVIGQDFAVNTILFNIYHNQRILESGDKDLISSKVNMLIDGPTGTGKSFILKEVSKNLSIPMEIVPADSFSSAGYKGAQLEDVLVKLLDKTGGNVELAERGIVVFDEFDKLCDTGDNSLEMHKAVQHGLLTYIGGTKISFEYKGQMVNFDTSKVTFICVGAFTDLREKKIKEELDENGNYTITSEDYIDAGMIRELIGRFSLLTSTRALGKADYIKILIESITSPLLRLRKEVKIYNKELIVDEGVVEAIAEEAVKMNTGARALDTIVQGIKNHILKTAIETVDVKEIYITLDMLEKYKNGFVRMAVA